MMINQYDMRDHFTSAGELIDRIGSWTDASTPDGADEVAGNLRYLVLLRQQIERVTRETVLRLRDQDVPWSTIANGLGVSKQSAWERYSSSP